MIRSTLAQIRQIARSGDTVRAWRMFDAAGLLQSRDIDALTLKGRLLKDRALRSEGMERSALLREAQRAYLQAANSSRATYPLINAATLAFLNNSADEAADLARKVLALLDSGNHVQETRYWLAATAAEAQLLLGNQAASQAALSQAMAAAPDAWEDHAATLRQFHEILTRQGQSTSILDPLRPPPTLYFSGIIGLPENENEAREKIEAALDQIAPGAAFGALAAGADILIAECAFARGIQLHIVLPTALDVFRLTSVGQFGSHWLDRFDRLIEMADSLEAPDTITSLSHAAIDKGSEIAMGLALRHAEALATQAIALHVGRGSDLFSPAYRLWQARGLPAHNIVLGQSMAPQGGPLMIAANKAVLVSTACASSTMEESANGLHFQTFDDIAMAMLQASLTLKAWPEHGFALEYRTGGTDSHLDEGECLAFLLAPAAPPGSICMPWPQAAAMALHGPGYRFEAAGEVMTCQGDCPVGHYYPPSS
ncbi:hypothetical protein CP98_03543 [Sphingobium yanoikuyae]|uniref:Uncharacterized protein n=1 Tax=Sphingobium yanoikuyae TaxID=13690 RepID=A0A084EH96_SPHYA|nr:hypothetical protein CP98_03543 [Sphingobium yanoikuyae]